MKNTACKILLSCLMCFSLISHAQSQVIEGNAANLKAISLDNKDILYFFHDSIHGGIAGRTDSAGATIWRDTLPEGQRLLNDILTFENGSKFLLSSFKSPYASDTNIIHFSVIDTLGVTYATYIDTVKGEIISVEKRDDFSFYLVNRDYNSGNVFVTAHTLTFDTLFNFINTMLSAGSFYHLVPFSGDGIILISNNVSSGSAWVVKTGYNGTIDWSKNINLGYNFYYMYIQYATTIGDDILLTGTGQNTQSPLYNLFFLIDSAGNLIKKASHLLPVDIINQANNYYAAYRTIYNDSLIYLLGIEGWPVTQYRLFTFNMDFERLCDMPASKPTGRYLEMFNDAYETRDTTINNVKHTVFSPLNCTEVLDNSAVSEKSLFQKEIIYPNPSNGLYNYSIHLNPAFGNEDLTINIIDISGKIIYTQKPDVTNGIVTGQLNLGNIPDGMYLYSISDRKGRQLTKRLIKIGEKK